MTAPPNKKWCGIRVQDFDFFKTIVQKYNIKSVLEFGTGVSTWLFEDLGLTVYPYETNPEYAKIVQQFIKTPIRLWDNKNLTDEIPKVDMAFIDGPNDREQQIEIGKKAAKYLVLHDKMTVNRKNKMRLQKKSSGWLKMPEESMKCVMFKRRFDYEV